MGKKKKPEELDLSRRDFMTAAGLGVVGAATVGRVAAADDAAETAATSENVQLILTINGRKHRLLVEARWSLLFVLREQLGLTGTKVGCERGECGACAVLIDGIPRYACMTLAVEAEGHAITTVEGLLEGEELGVVQRAFREQDAFQCGYCTSGQIVAVEGLLRQIPEPSHDQIRTGVSGNLCRCGAYPNIFRAAGRAAEIKRSEGGA
jgi:xanthine dehydrogenase YagT iron-sulfur-binding subunit